MFLECLAQCGLRGGSGVEERLIIEWTVIERNVLQCARPTIFFTKYNLEVTVKYNFMWSWNINLTENPIKTPSFRCFDLLNGNVNITLFYSQRSENIAIDFCLELFTTFGFNIPTHLISDAISANDMKQSKLNESQVQRRIEICFVQFVQFLKCTWHNKELCRGAGWCTMGWWLKGAQPKKWHLINQSAPWPAPSLSLTARVALDLPEMLLGHGKESSKMPRLFEDSDSLEVMEVYHLHSTRWHMIRWTGGCCKFWCWVMSSEVGLWFRRERGRLPCDGRGKGKLSPACHFPCQARAPVS